MKLLTRQELNTKKTQSFIQEKTEGMKLARRVDTLREVHATEEASLEKFRRETIKKIHEETTQAATERDLLLEEVRNLKSERAELQKPLDEEWKRVEDIRTGLLEDIETVVEREEAVLEAEKTVLDDKKTVFDLLEQAKNRDLVSKELYKDASQDRAEAKEAKADAEKTKIKTEELRQEVLAELMHRDSAMAIKEKDLILKAEHLKLERIQLRKDWKLLKDRQEMFERNFNRNQS